MVINGLKRELPPIRAAGHGQKAVGEGRNDAGSGLA